VHAEPTAIAGCVHLRLTRHDDARGDFVKAFRRDRFAELGLDPTVAEVYWSTSRRGVVRGLHYQTPPHDHAKTVSVCRGAVHDVVVDLRCDSPSYGHVLETVLSVADAGALHIPAGCAHGFQALSEEAVVAYMVGTEHAPSHDTGVRWDSVGAHWPIAGVVISERDAAFPTLAEMTPAFHTT
jgi:dTDP-4-dehydrorhamnose 3,5-epimerase